MYFPRRAPKRTPTNRVWCVCVGGLGVYGLGFKVKNKQNNMCAIRFSGSVYDFVVPAPNPRTLIMLQSAILSSLRHSFRTISIAGFGGHRLEFKFDLVPGFWGFCRWNADRHLNYNCTFNVYLTGLNRTSEPIRFGSVQKPLWLAFVMPIISLDGAVFSLHCVQLAQIGIISLVPNTYSL